MRAPRFIARRRGASASGPALDVARVGGARGHNHQPGIITMRRDGRSQCPSSGDSDTTNAGSRCPTAGILAHEIQVMDHEATKASHATPEGLPVPYAGHWFLPPR